MIGGWKRKTTGVMQFAIQGFKETSAEARHNSKGLPTPCATGAMDGRGQRPATVAPKVSRSLNGGSFGDGLVGRGALEWSLSQEVTAAGKGTGGPSSVRSAGNNGWRLDDNAWVEKGQASIQQRFRTQERISGDGRGTLEPKGQ